MDIASLIGGFFAGAGTPFAWVAMFITLGFVVVYGYGLGRIYGPDERATLAFGLLAGVTLYVCLNLIAAALGIRGLMDAAEIGENKTLSMIGLSVPRIAPPLAGGLNGFALTAVLGCALAVGVARASRGWCRCFSVFMLAPNIAGAIVVDSRAAVGLGVLSVLLGGVYTRRRWLVGLTMAAIIVVPHIARPMVEHIEASGIADFLRRENSASATTLGIASGREVIWGAVSDKIIGHLHGLTGYGNMGHATSGASAQYSWVFAEQGATAHSCHNASLQRTIDMGLLGLVAWTLFWLVNLGALAQPTRLHTAIAAPCVFVFLMSFTEAAGTLYTLDSYAIVLLLFSLAAGAFAWTEPAPSRAAMPLPGKAWGRRQHGAIHAGLPSINPR